MRNTAIWSVLAPLLWLIAGSAAAQFEADSNAPVEITADALEWMNEERIAIARGNADAVQGRYRLHADVLTAHFRSDDDNSGDTVQDGIRMIEADGNVRLETPDETVRGAAGTYDVENGLVSLVGEVVLAQGESVARGDRLEMNLNTGVSRLTALPASGRRVSAVFTPNQDESDTE